MAETDKVWCVDCQNYVNGPCDERCAEESHFEPVSDKPELEEGAKYDTGKIRLDLIPPELITAVGTILTFGANKYADRNWEKGMSWGRVFGALMRHLWAWWSGKDKDEETGESHLWHAACCIAFLIAYEERGVGEDTRAHIPRESV